MSEKKKEVEEGAAVNELATRIYVELVARNVQIAEGAVKMGASAENLATLSLKLAEAFVQTEQKAIAAKAPVTSYKLEGSDIASWTK
jgi:hypothetical protein